MNTIDLLSSALSIGEALLRAGAEVHRVEDSIERICIAYGAQRAHIFAIPSVIIATVQCDGEEPVTQICRISSISNDLNKVDRLNNLSRYICRNKPDKQVIQTEIKKITTTRGYPLPIRILIYFAVAFSFCLFFGGTWLDASASGAIAIVLMFIIIFFDRLHTNRVFSSIVSSAFAGGLAVVCIFFGFGTHIDEIIIGNIMLLIPGIALTNGMRDFVAGDLLAGILRICEAVLHGAGIALGAAAATRLLGGVLL